ncbi:SprB-like repeat protein [Chitinophaga dinghuensis]|uniref:SprB-like repeat protein n=1 Tax=Chitinophaga dinghuensis TaxID=1539050 RepID=A0A327WDX7_9BACT|nr:hypothetical protein [Chitinophaga dinghuensis]RAJ87606.1 SprB-like repeat protein [Chitinophaga dinghuensis]
MKRVLLFLLLLAPVMLPAQTTMDAGYQVDWRFNFHHGGNWPCGNYVRYHLTLTNGSVRQMINYEQGWIKCNTGFNINEGNTIYLNTWEIPSNIRFTYDITTQRINSGSCNTCKGTGYWTPSYDTYLHTFSDLCNVNVYRSWTDGPENGNYSFKVTPFINKLLTTNTENNILPELGNVILTAPAGLPRAMYNWEYNVNGGAFQPLPAGISTATEYQRTFTATQLFGATQAAAYCASAARIGFRIRLCNNIYNNGILYLTCRLSAPQPLSFTQNEILCAGGKGTLKVHFSRALRNDLQEQLTIRLADPVTKITKVEMTNITLDANNDYTWPVPINEDNYEVNFTGTYVPFGGFAAIATYTGDPAYFKQITVQAPPPVVFNVVKSNDERCYQSKDGVFTVSASGGKQGFVLKLKKPTDADYVSYPMPGNAITISGLAKGSYLVQVVDKNDCQGKNNRNETIETVIVDGPSTPLDAISATMNDPLAFGSSDGSITVYLKGGTPFPGPALYQVTWKRSDGTIISNATNSPGSSNDYITNISNLPQGTYTLIVTDNNFSAVTTGNPAGCTYTANYTLTQPPKLLVTAFIRDSVLCNGDKNATLSLTAQGGKPKVTGQPYKYEWFVITGGITTSIGTSLDLDAVGAGDYQVTITDANGITATSNVVHLIDPPVLKAQLSTRNVSCFSGSDATISSTVTGGTGTYRYKWNTNATTPGLTAVPEGDYDVLITDVHGCNVHEYTSITQPSRELRIEEQQTIYPLQFGSADGNIRVVVNGATPKKDGSYQITWTKSDGTVISQHTDNTVANGYQTYVDNLPAGKYMLTVTDSLYDPTAIASDRQTCYLQREFELIEPPLLTIHIDSIHYVSCKSDADAILKAIADGGIPLDSTPKYRYDWYRVDNGTRVALNDRRETITGLPAGTYQVRVTDFNNIQKYSQSFVVVEPDSLLAPLSTRDISCYGGNDGFVKTTVTGGTLPYTISWSNGSSDIALNDMPAGTYNLTVVDAHGCMVSHDTALHQPATPLAIEAEEWKNPLAFTYTDGYIKVTFKGGTKKADNGYDVEWKNQLGQTLTTVTNTVTPNGYESLLSQVGDGKYTVTVKDAQFSRSTNGSVTGCFVTETYTLKEPPLLEAEIERTRIVTCYKRTDGQLTAHAKGGIPATNGLPYTYDWYRVENGVETQLPGRDSILKGLGAGFYLVKVTDENSITRSSPVFELVQPDTLSVTLTSTPVSCESGQDGTATSTVTGGTSPFTYEWTTGDNTPNISNVTEGTFFVFVKDVNGCVAQNTVEIYIPGGIKTDEVVTQPLCNNYCDGAITLNMSGGVPPYRYEWNDGITTKDRTGLCAGNYTVTITDHNNCKRIQHFVLNNPAPLKVDLGTERTLCNGQTFTINAAIADPRATYSWTGSNGFTSNIPEITFSQQGDYQLVVTDGNGCSGTGTLRVKQTRADIAAEFVASTQVFRGEYVSFINISNPRPESNEWIIPTGSNIKILQNTPLLAELQFADTGTYVIQLKSKVGACEALFSKSIKVLDDQRIPTPGGANAPFIKTFEISPNPNTGQFAARITLDKASGIRLRLVNIMSNQLVSDRQASGAADYNLTYSLSIPAGTYVMVLETPLGNMIRKIIINN